MQCLNCIVNCLIVLIFSSFTLILKPQFSILSFGKYLSKNPFSLGSISNPVSEFMYIVTSKDSSSEF